MQPDTVVAATVDSEKLAANAHIAPIADPFVGAAANLNSPTVLLHVRFRPDATILQIDERPAELTDEEWYKRLCARAGAKYATRVGGRGFFRLTRSELDALKVQRPN